MRLPRSETKRRYERCPVCTAKTKTDHNGMAVCARCRWNEVVAIGRSLDREHAELVSDLRREASMPFVPSRSARLIGRTRKTQGRDGRAA